MSNDKEEEKKKVSNKYKLLLSPPSLFVPPLALHSNNDQFHKQAAAILMEAAAFHCLKWKIFSPRWRMEEWRWKELPVDQEVGGASADTHVHELHVSFGARGLVKDLDGHRDLHRLALRNPDALRNNNNKNKYRLGHVPISGPPPIGFFVAMEINKVSL